MRTSQTIMPVRNLREFRRHYQGLTRALLSSLSGITINRLTSLELCKGEPWLDEICKLAGVLNCDAHELISPLDLAGFINNPIFFDRDIIRWKLGSPVPLQRALRLQHRFGLARLEDLIVPDYARQLWSVLEATERHPEAPGWCAWCQADIAGGELHKDHCTPTLMLGGAKTSWDNACDDEHVTLGSYEAAATAHGLTTVREAAGLTQKQLAQVMGLDPQMIWRYENGKSNLKVRRAKDLAVKLNLPDFNVIYVRPTTVLPTTPVT
jgi:transcriptional regulator with XRE-family HTH domain